MSSANSIPSNFDIKPAPITVAYGDGIGPEIMTAVLRILEAAGAKLDINKIDIGEKVYLSGNTAGIEPEAWDSLRKTGVFFKAPITTPQGGGYKSLNVTVVSLSDYMPMFDPLPLSRLLWKQNTPKWMLSLSAKMKKTSMPGMSTAKPMKSINV